MDHFTVVVIIGACTLLAGLVIGLMIGRSQSDGQQLKALQGELDSTTREFEEYKLNVSEHFTRTADLVNNLTESYREVHQHLANSAESFCGENQLTADIKPPLPEKPVDEENQESEEQTAPEVVEKPQDALEAPKDYAPKADPEAEGTLSENFGLQSKEEELEHDPSKTADHAKS